MRGSSEAVNVNDIPVAGLVPYVLSPRSSSVRTDTLITGIVALSRRRCVDESGQEAFATKPP
jgi:hypothetical protein